MYVLQAQTVVFSSRLFRLFELTNYKSFFSRLTNKQHPIVKLVNGTFSYNPLKEFVCAFSLTVSGTFYVIWSQRKRNSVRGI